MGKKVNRQPSIGSRVAIASLEQVSETDMTSLGISLKQSTLESEGMHGHGNVARERQTNYVSNKIEKPKVLKSSQRVSTIDLFDLSIESTSSHIDKTFTSEDQVDTTESCVDKGSILKSNPVFFPECDSSLDNCKVSIGNSDVSLFHPSCLTNSDHLSTLGSIDADLG